MPIRDAVQRLQNYNLKLNPERVKQDLESHRSGMLARQEAAFTALAEIEDKVAAILASEDIPTPTYIWYYDFAREAFRLRRRFGGGKGLEKEVALLIYKWKERTASEQVLIRIRDEVLGIPAAL